MIVLGSFGSGGDLPAGGSSSGINAGDCYVCDTVGYYSEVGVGSWDAGEYAIAYQVFSDSARWRKYTVLPTGEEPSFYVSDQTATGNTLKVMQKDENENVEEVGKLIANTNFSINGNSYIPNLPDYFENDLPEFDTKKYLQTLPDEICLQYNLKIYGQYWDAAFSVWKNRLIFSEIIEINGSGNESLLKSGYWRTTNRNLTENIYQKRNVFESNLFSEYGVYTPTPSYATACIGHYWQTYTTDNTEWLDEYEIIYSGLTFDDLNDSEYQTIATAKLYDKVYEIKVKLNSVLFLNEDDGFTVPGGTITTYLNKEADFNMEIAIDQNVSSPYSITETITETENAQSIGYTAVGTTITLNSDVDYITGIWLIDELGAKIEKIYQYTYGDYQKALGVIEDLPYENSIYRVDEVRIGYGKLGDSPYKFANDFSATINVNDYENPEYSTGGDFYEKNTILTPPNTTGVMNYGDLVLWFHTNGFQYKIMNGEVYSISASGGSAPNTDIPTQCPTVGDSIRLGEENFYNSGAAWIDAERADVETFYSDLGGTDGASVGYEDGYKDNPEEPAPIDKGSFGSSGDLPMVDNSIGDHYKCDTDGYLSTTGITFDTNDYAAYTSDDWIKIEDSTNLTTYITSYNTSYEEAYEEGQLVDNDYLAGYQAGYLIGTLRGESDEIYDKTYPGYDNLDKTAYQQGYYDGFMDAYDLAFFDKERYFYVKIKDYKSDGETTKDLYLQYANLTQEILGSTAEDDIINNSILVYPESLSQELDIKENTSTISSLIFSLINKDMELSEIIYSDFYNEYNLYDKKVEVNIYNSAEEETVLVYTGYLKDITHDKYETKYTIELQDGLDKLKDTSLTYTTLDNEIFSIDTDLSENPTAATSGIFDRLGRKKDEGNTTYFVNNYVDTTDQTTFDNWTEDKWVILTYTGHPIELAKYLMDELEVEYDTTTFAEVKTDSKNADISEFYFEWKEPIDNTLEFITEQIFKPLNCFPVIKEDGKIYLKLHKQPTVLDLPTILDNDNIIDIIDVETTRDNIINHTFVNFDYNTETKEYISQVYDVENEDTTFATDSVLAFGFKPKTPEALEFRGLNKYATINGTQALSDRITFARNSASYLFSRFALATKIIRKEVLYSIGKDIELGDVVVIQGTNLLRWKGTGKGTVRGLPVISTEEYGLIDSAIWGEYAETYEGNLFLDDKTTNESIEVKELITLGFFEDLLENYNYNITFLTEHERLT